MTEVTPRHLSEVFKDTEVFKVAKRQIISVTLFGFKAILNSKLNLHVLNKHCLKTRISTLILN